MSTRRDIPKSCGRINQKNPWVVNWDKIMKNLTFRMKVFQIHPQTILILMRILTYLRFPKIWLSTNTCPMISVTSPLILWYEWNIAMIILCKICWNQGIKRVEMTSNQHQIPMVSLIESKTIGSFPKWFLASFKFIRTGVVHRDLKPENIFLNKECNQSQIKIGDFGLA